MWDVGIKISGFSADVPVFLAILSAALKTGVNDKIAFTGHIASTDGTVSLGEINSRKITSSYQ